MSKLYSHSISDDIFTFHYLTTNYKPSHLPRTKKPWLTSGLNFLLLIQVGFVAIALWSPKSLAINTLSWIPKKVVNVGYNSPSQSPNIIYASSIDQNALTPYLGTPAPVPTPTPTSQPAAHAQSIPLGSRPALRLGLIAPLQQEGITQPFIPGVHTGVDYRANTGTPINAAITGTVIEAKTSGWNGGWGETILVDNGGGMTTRYAHLSHLDVSVGDTVKQGQTIALSGATGHATGPHLHFEVRMHNVPTNPL